MFPKIILQIFALRNEDKTSIMIPGCSDGLKMDNINNPYGDYWGFYFGHTHPATGSRLAIMVAFLACLSSMISIKHLTINQ